MAPQSHGSQKTVRKGKGVDGAPVSVPPTAREPQVLNDQHWLERAGILEGLVREGRTPGLRLINQTISRSSIGMPDSENKIYICYVPSVEIGSEDTVRKNNDIPEDIEAGGEILGPDGVVKGTITAYLLTQEQAGRIKARIKEIETASESGGIAEASTPFNGLLLTEEQVMGWPGMRVAIVMEGNDHLEVDKEGQPLILQALDGGVPHRTLLLPVEAQGDNEQIHASALAGFKPDVRFMPVVVFPVPVFSSGLQVPPGEYAVFKDGAVVRYGKREGGFSKPSAVVVSVDRDGKPWLGNDADWWLEDHRDFAIPEDVVLVPFSRPKHS